MEPRVGGRRAEVVECVEEDRVRTWLGSFAVAEKELVEGFRRCREVVIGGLERSFFTGSASAVGVFERRFEADLWRPPIAGFALMLVRVGGGRMGALPVALPEELGGRAIDVALRVVGLTGSRLGD